eukprot:9063656-Alexandrium_andersonii.AAC.1
MAPRSTPFSWPTSKPWARRNPSGRPCAGIGPNCFSAQSRMAPAWGERPSKKVLARCFHRRWPCGWASMSNLGYEPHARWSTAYSRGAPRARRGP